jgi:hypothetical protein
MLKEAPERPNYAVATTAEGGNTDKTALYIRDVSGVQWHKSSHSIEFDCVEVAGLGDGAVALRDSTDYTRAPLRFTAAEWAAFTAGVRDGQF